MKTFHLVPLDTPSQVKLAESLTRSGTASQLSDLQRNYDEAFKSRVPDDVKIQQLEGVLADLGVFQKRLLELKREAAQAARPPAAPRQPVSTPLNRGRRPPSPAFTPSSIASPPSSIGSSPRRYATPNTSPASSRAASPTSQRSPPPVTPLSGRVKGEEESSSDDSVGSTYSPAQIDVRRSNLTVANEILKPQIAQDRNFTDNQKAAANRIIDIFANRADIFTFHKSGRTVWIPGYKGGRGEYEPTGLYNVPALLTEMVKNTEPSQKTLNFVNEAITRGAFTERMVGNWNNKMEAALLNAFKGWDQGPGTSSGRGLYTWFTL